VSDQLTGVPAGPGRLPTVSVVIAAFTMDRWAELQAAVASVRSQTISMPEVIVVIDHNPDLLARARRMLSGVTVVANAAGRGASGSRNTGVAASRAQVVAFLDDDAVASPAWLESMLGHFGDPRVVGVGGHVDPLWECRQPRWFPPEFGWAVGVSYRGMPQAASPVRNVWSGNMVIRRDVFDAIGGFRAGFGKVGGRSSPEDTDLCMRASAAFDRGVWIYEPNGRAWHRVPASRATPGFFLRRCFREGRGKAALAALNGTAESTGVERRYVRRFLPAGIAHGLREALRGDLSGGLRSAAMGLGLSSVVAGYLTERYGGIVTRNGTAVARPRSRDVLAARREGGARRADSR